MLDCAKNRILGKMWPFALWETVMDKKSIVDKFGAKFHASGLTFKMGISHRFTDHVAKRFRGRVVLETCTGGGFMTIGLAQYAKYVFTAEIVPERQKDAQYNVGLAGASGNVNFIGSDVFDVEIGLFERNRLYLDGSHVAGISSAMLLMG